VPPQGDLLITEKSSLRQKRVLFTYLSARLIDKAFDLGFEPAIDQVKRTQAEANANAKSGAGIRNSLHLLGLAMDLLLYKDLDGDGDVDYASDSKHYKTLGDWWKLQHPLCRWGGDFRKVDGNHFSITHGGVS
jgi:hypothetical protein